QSVWASNLNGGTAPNADNRGKLHIRTSSAYIAAGPRIVEATQGAIGEPGDTLNNTRAADGTPILSQFIVNFDRPVDPASFDGTDVTVEYRDVNTPGTSAATATIMNNVTNAPISVV